MKAEEIYAGNLFGGGQQLLIPLWQRHYSWEKPQWSELWTDLIRVRDDDQAGHFLGSVVLKSLPWTGFPSEAKRFWVVDGQQRVTTLTLLICAIRDRLARLAPTDDERADRQREYTSQLLLNTNLKEGHRDRLVLQEKDRALLAPLVHGTWAGGRETLIDRAYDYFRQELSTQTESAVNGLLSIVLAKLSAVWVTLEAGDNAHRVFQTLNAGGKKLRQSDLVRNYFFLLLGDLGDSFYASNWRQMESDLTDRELEQYLVAWSISQGYTGGRDSLFEYFHRDLLPFEHDPDRVLGYGKILTATARYFGWIANPTDSDFGSEVLRSLNALRNWSTLPAEGLILWLIRRSAEDHKLDETYLSACLEVVLSFMARRQLAGYEPNLHKSIFVATTHKLRNRLDLTNSETLEYLTFLLSSGEEVRTWPSDEVVKSTARSTPIYSSSRASWTFSLLERANRELFENKKHAPPTLDRTKYSIEHVLPQTLTSAWTSDLEEWGVQNPAELHQSHLHVLGNLSLTPVNSELGNLPFEEKRALLADDWLRLNADVSSASTWTQHRIDERSSMLANRLCSAYSPPMPAEQIAKLHLKYSDGKMNTDEIDVVQAALDEEGG